MSFYESLNGASLTNLLDIYIVFLYIYFGYYYGFFATISLLKCKCLGMLENKSELKMYFIELCKDIEKELVMVTEIRIRQDLSYHVCKHL